MPPITPENLRAVALITIVAILFAGRLTKGAAKETPDGLLFGMKPLVLWTRLLAVPLYLAFVFFPIFTQHRHIPIWVPAIILLAAAFACYQLPGTILLTPTAVIQRFWFRADKAIQYPEVMAIQVIQGGRITRVLGDNRVAITHTSAHTAAATFRTELERRTNKRIST